MNEPGYDVIGDVHGHVGPLEILLGRLGYADRNGAWRHPTRTVVFVGDLIDRGPSQLGVLRLVRAMVDRGSARIVLGNHEFNAVAFATLDPVTSEFCRSHNDKHTSQHRRFLDEVGFDTPDHRAIIDWFRTIPMWLRLDGLDVVHACWSSAHIEALSGVLGPGDVLTDAAVVAHARRTKGVYEAIEVLLKGPEIDLDGSWFLDKDRHPRGEARLSWWQAPTTLCEGAWIPPDAELHDAAGQRITALSDRDLTPGERIGGDGEHPVLFGHYWLRQEAPALSARAACLDFSVAADGTLGAYRWNVGDTSLEASRLVFA